MSMSRGEYRRQVFERLEVPEEMQEIRPPWVLMALYAVSGLLSIAGVWGLILALGWQGVLVIGAGVMGLGGLFYSIHQWRAMR